MRKSTSSLCLHGEPKGRHDCMYVSAREFLIPAAEREANTVAGERPKSGTSREAWVTHWDRTFHEAMAHLWAEHGARLYAKAKEDARRAREGN